MRRYEIPPRQVRAGKVEPEVVREWERGRGGAFPLHDNEPQAGITWWSAMTEERRAHWLMMAASAVPAAAHHPYLLAQAYNDAFEEVNRG
jgi:hypothetical protein